MEELRAVHRRPLRPLLEEAADQQQEDQQRDAVEIDRAAVGDGVDRPPHETGAERECDRDVDVHRALADGHDRGAEEDAPRPDHARRRQQQRQPPKARLEDRLERAGTAHEAAVERDREQHDVRGQRTGDADVHQQRAILGTPHRLGPEPAKRMRTIAERLEIGRDPGERHRPGVPGDRGEGARDVELGAQHTVEHHRHPLHQPDAARAVHSFEVELHRGDAARPLRHIERVERRMVEGRVIRTHRRDGRGASLVEVVVAPEAGRVDDLVRRAAPGTAELRSLHDAVLGRRYRQGAVRAPARADVEVRRRVTITQTGLRGRRHVSVRHAQQRPARRPRAPCAPRTCRRW